MRDPARIPVIVGVGQINDRPRDPAEGLDSVGLMEAALRLADTDAGGGWLARIDSLAVVRQVSFPGLDEIPGRLAASIGARPRLCHMTASASGDSPILLLNEAVNHIAAGEIECAAIVGGEALRTAAQLAAAASGDDPSAHNLMRTATSRRAPSYRQRYGLTAPVDVYPLYENAGRAAYGQSLVEAQAESGEIWSRFSQVAAENPNAWIRRPMSAEQIIAPSADNRPIAFPYAKLMVANSSVNQGAGFIVMSLAMALARGMPAARLVYVGRGAAAHEPEHVLQRDRFDRSPSMAVSLRRTLELNDLTSADLDFVELYSCFPCVPKMARRVIDWPTNKPATVFWRPDVRRQPHRQLHEPCRGQHDRPPSPGRRQGPAIRQWRIRHPQPFDRPQPHSDCPRPTCPVASTFRPRPMPSAVKSPGWMRTTQDRASLRPIPSSTNAMAARNPASSSRERPAEPASFQ